jgi:hypothetical protein
MIQAEARQWILTGYEITLYRRSPFQRVVDVCILARPRPFFLGWDLL